MYRFPVVEKPIPIHKLLIYPVRGVNGIEVDKLELTSGGAKLDREWVIIRLSDNKQRSINNGPEVLKLRQKFIYNEYQSKPEHL